MPKATAPDAGAVLDGAKVQQLRKAKGWNRDELAHETGLNTGTLEKIEQGHSTNVRTKTLIAIAAALGVTTDALLTRE